MSARIRSLNDFLALLKGLKRARDGQYLALCPGHADTKPSLSVKESNGKILIKCHAGCELTDILKPLGLETKDLFLNGRKLQKQKQKKQKTVAAIFSYKGASGEESYQIRRYSPKTFEVWHGNKKGEYVPGLGGNEPVPYKLPELLEWIKQGRRIYIPEGEGKADRLIQLGLAATTAPFGASLGKWLPDYNRHFHGAEIVILADNDKVGMEYAEEKAQNLASVAKNVKLLLLSNLPPKGDILDWLDNGGTVKELEQLVANCPEYEPPKTLTRIRTNNRQLRDVTDEALATLYEANKTNPEIFTRAGNLVRVRVDERGNPYIDSLTESALRGVLTRTTDFIRVNAASTKVLETEVSPPLDVVRDILSLKHWEFAQLAALTEVPVIQLDGTILTQPGHDAVTGLYYRPPPRLDLPSIPDTPMEGDVRQAITLIKEVIYDFPFDSKASASNALATMLTPVLRPIIDGLVPLAIFDKPQPGTGASLLCDVVALIATGRTAGMIGGHRKEEEWRKEITTILLHGHMVIVIDNVDSFLYSPSLATVLTARVWRDRILGHNEDALLPNLAIWIANGNNIRLLGDLPRRAYWVRLDAQLAQPWLRQPNQFKHPDLIKWVKERRSDIIAAMLTVARAWISDDKPKPQNLITIGGYESFCQVLGSILGYMKVEGFLQNLPQMYAEMDAETPQWEHFLEAWHEIFGDQGVTVAEVIKKLNENEGFAATQPDGVADKDIKGYSRKLGNALAKRKDVRFSNGLMIQKAEIKHHAVAWKVVTVDATKLPGFSFGGELGSQGSTPRGSENKKTDEAQNTNSKGMQPDSPDSHLATKTGELAKTPLQLPDGRVVNWAWCLTTWHKLGRPVIHVGDRDNIFDLSLYLYPEKISPQRLLGIVNWLQTHSKERMPEGVNDALPDF